MKPTRSKLPPRTPRKAPPHTKATGKDPVKVFCRVKPINHDHEATCLTVVSDTTIQISPPDSAVSARSGVCKEIQYTFHRVFDQSTKQKDMFDHIALPLVDDLIRGRNGLLFTYGVTGCGKTYTMIGNSRDGGILPRCLDVLFNSIEDLKAPKYTFKPDKMNGFEVLTDVDIMRERSLELGNAKVTKSTHKRKVSRDRARDTNKLAVHEDYAYSIFVTYIEIYNNNVYDLLEEVTDDVIRTRSLQTKLIREDARHGMYAHGVTETEITSADEGYEAFCKGQTRRRIAETALNMESSRSHSVFTLRLVQLPKSSSQASQDRTDICISQLSLVDLAGSERNNRTNARGDRQREAGKINNSLMSLRTCLEVLREKQNNGGDAFVPYRDSRLTLLFKSFFEGEGAIRMVVCVNPWLDDYDETVQVMKFAEMTQEVLVSRPAATREAAAASSTNLITTRKRGISSSKENVLDKKSKSSSSSEDERRAGTAATAAAYNGLAAWPSLILAGHSDEHTCAAIIDFVNARVTAKDAIAKDLHARASSLRQLLVETERANMASAQESACARATLESERQRLAETESRAVQFDAREADLRRQVVKLDRDLSAARQQLREKESQLNQRELEKDRAKQQYKTKLEEERERLARESKLKLKKREAELKGRMQSRDEKLQQVKRIIDEPDARRMVSSAVSRFEAQSTESLVSRTPQPPRPTRRLGTVVSNPRYRRSRSTGDVWIDHRSGVAALGTVMQPTMHRRISVNKLTDIRDVTGAASKYCLTTQEYADDGVVETRLYKGDVLPTCGGGAQMVLNDVETLRQESPIASPVRTTRSSGRSGRSGRSRSTDRLKRSQGSSSQEEVTSKCSVAIEGHAKRSRR